MDETKRHHLEKLRQANERRLRVLEERAATLGINTPAEVVTEIEDIQDSLDSLNKQLGINEHRLPINPYPGINNQQSKWLIIGVIGIFFLMLGLWWARQFAFIIPPIQSTPATLAISTLTSLTPSNSTPAAITPATPTIPKLTSDIPTTSISANTTLPISNSSSTDKITGKITFSALKDGNQEIYVANTDGSNVHRITVNPSDDAAPAWSPNGKRIAFHSNRGSDHYYHIYVIDIDNHDEPIQSEPIQITEGSSNDQDPTWSPNGESIAFHSNRDNDDNFYNIYVINIAAMDLKPLTKGSHKYLYPTWSEDGNLIAYTSDECHTQCVYVMSSSDGRKLRQLTSEPIYAANPKWSRDGKYIAFQGTLGANSYIYVVDANGNDTPRQITNLISSYWPSWSPNDKQIAFQSNHNAQNEIYVINADGGGEPIKIELGFDEQEYPDWQR